MGFCKYGNTQVIGSGVYYICSVTNYPCKFARWCQAALVYKPNANFHSCNIKIKQDRTYLDEVNKSKVEAKVEKVPFVEEPVIEEPEHVENVVVKEEVKQEDVAEVKTTSRRKKKASS